jgi:hypothetical protein
MDGNGLVLEYRDSAGDGRPAAWLSDVILPLPRESIRLSAATHKVFEIDASKKD